MKGYTTHIEGGWTPGEEDEEEFDTHEDPVVVLFPDHAEISRRQGLWLLSFLPSFSSLIFLLSNTK